MIKTKKRSAENHKDEPFKKKSPIISELKPRNVKVEGSGVAIADKAKKFNKSVRPATGGVSKGKFASKPGGKPVAAGKFVKKFGGKPGEKGFKPRNEKVEGSTPTIAGNTKKFNKRPTTAGSSTGKYATKPGAAVKFVKKFGGKPGEKGADGKPGASGKFVNKFAGNPNESGPPAEASEKTDWRKFKQEKRDLKVKRKQAKDSYDISIEAKQIYEKLKCRRTEKKNELVEKLFNLLSGGDTLKKLVMAHDTARIIQCMLKFASPSLRDQISEKLLPLVVGMSVSKYSHFCVLRMFKYGSPSIKSKLVDTFMGNVVRLACHSISSKILDHVYLSVANAKQKIYMRQEFYGELYRNSKDEKVKQLSDTYKDTANMKASMLSAVKANLEHVANKQLVDNSLVHAVMLEFLRECDEEKLEETVSMFATLIPLMLTTKDGCQASIICFYKSTPKNRRAIIKTIKEHLVKICTHEHGHIFILALLNSLDDTKATKKAIYDSVHPELETLMANQWGRRVIEWLISPADTNCFHPTFITNIEEGLQYGKKDKDVRRKEIFEQIEEPIASAIAEKPEFWISNRHIGLVTAEILKKISATNFVKAATALAAIIADPQWTVVVEEETKEKKSKDFEKIITDAIDLKKKKLKAVKKVKQQTSEEAKDNDDDDEHKDEDDEKKENDSVTVSGIEEAGLHIVLKKIIKNDKERLAQSADAETFGSILGQQLTEQTLKYWLTVNRACFVLLNIVENNNDSTAQTFKKLLKSQQTLLKQQTTSGAKLLSKKLSL